MEKNDGKYYQVGKKKKKMSGLNRVGKIKTFTGIFMAN